MQITCSICRELFVATDAVVRTSCGHLFHLQCLKPWLEMSKSCPQCRAKSSEENVSRIYFNVGLHNARKEDNNTLRNKIDSLEFNMLSINNQLKICNEEITEMRNKATKLKNEKQYWKGKVDSARSNNYMLEELFNILKKNNGFLEPVLTECERSQKEVHILQNIKTVMKGSAEEVDKILKDFGASGEVNDLVTCTTFLKKDMDSSEADKEGLSTKLHEAQSKVFSLSCVTFVDKVRRLEEELKAEDEKNDDLLLEISNVTEEQKSLRKKIDALQQVLLTPTDSHPCIVALKCILSESPTSNYSKRACLDTSGVNLLKSPDPTTTPAIDRKASPNLNIKSLTSCLSPLELNKTNREMRNYKIIQMSDALMEHIDAPRGHSNLDDMPQPIPDVNAKKVDKYKRFSRIKLKDALKIKIPKRNILEANN